MPDKEYNCLTCPYPNFRTPTHIFCDVCMQKILAEHEASKQPDQPKQEEAPNE